MKPKWQPVRALVFAAFLASGTPALASPILIDTPPPSDPSSPWHSLAGDPIITFAFKTSWDGIAWADDQRAAVYDALDTLDDVLPANTFVESADFTLRWAGADFFKDYRDATHSQPGWDLTNPLAVAYKHGNGPWDQSKYPNNEIYFNTKYPWSYSLAGVEAGKYDFWSIVLHEVIHMLACDNHAAHPDEVMYSYFDKGERRYLQESDYDILRDAGYDVPEPTALILLAGGLAVMWARWRDGGPFTHTNC